MKRKDILVYAIATILIILGIFLSTIKKHNYFYMILSMGLLILVWKIHNHIFKNKLMKNFKREHQLFFWFSLIIVSVIADIIGTQMGFWKGSFNTPFELSIKYLFQWAIPFVSLMILFLIGKKFLENEGVNKTISFCISLFIFITIFGIFIEFLNQFSYSWTINSMPITNFKIGNYFVIMQTIGYWTMTMIPYSIYLITKRIFKIK